MQLPQWKPQTHTHPATGAPEHYPGVAGVWHPSERERMHSGLGALLTLIALGAMPVHAQTWPTKPLRLVVPFSPGGVTDITGRAVAAALREGLGQPVTVENKTGAQGTIGTAAVKAAEPDGHTLLIMSSSVVCVGPYLRKTFPFDPQKDFEPVGLIAYAPLMMVVSPTLPVNTLDEFIAYAKANADKRISFSSPGVGGSGHLYGAIMNQTSHLDMTHVPYQGGMPAIQAVIAGDVTMTFSDMGSASGLVKAGRVKALAVAGEKRWPLFPQVPTFSEIGYPINLVGWMGLAAPAGTPRSVVDRLGSELHKFAMSPANRDLLLNSGAQVAESSHDHMKASIRDGCPAWGNAVKSAGIEPE